MEIMYHASVSIIAHFLDKKRANDFANALRKTLDQTIEDKKILTILKNIASLLFPQSPLQLGNNFIA